MTDILKTAVGILIGAIGAAAWLWLAYLVGGYQKGSEERPDEQD